MKAGIALMRLLTRWLVEVAVNEHKAIHIDSAIRLKTRLSASIRKCGDVFCQIESGKLLTPFSPSLSAVSDST
jgi:hypothetical protein